MTIVDHKLDEPLFCVCGTQINHISIAYGSTPYLIHCPHCLLDLHKICPSGVSGVLENAIAAWNDYVSAVGYLREVKGIHNPRESQIRERFYRLLKGWDEP